MPGSVSVVQIEYCAFANIDEKTDVFTTSIMEDWLAGEYLQMEWEGIITFEDVGCSRQACLTCSILPVSRIFLHRINRYSDQ